MANSKNQQGNSEGSASKNPLSKPKPAPPTPKPTSNDTMPATFSEGPNKDIIEFTQSDE
jgi:hypothetical protein